MAPSSLRWTDIMATNDRGFFVELGKRIAQLRKDQGLTQQTLAAQLGIAQQTLAHYEGGTVAGAGVNVAATGADFWRGG